jgi:hypothetical protein
LAVRPQSRINSSIRASSVEARAIMLPPARLLLNY